MRFRKLRLFVGIAMIFFILAVANILVSGYFMKDKAIKESQDQNLAAFDNKKSLSQITIVNESSSSNNSQNNQNVSADTNNSGDTPRIDTPNRPSAPAPTSTVVHKTRKTRAS